MALNCLIKSVRGAAIAPQQICLSLFIVTHPLQIITHFFLYIYFSHPFNLQLYVADTNSVLTNTALHTVISWILNQSALHADSRSEGGGCKANSGRSCALSLSNE